MEETRTGPRRSEAPAEDGPRCLLCGSPGVCVGVWTVRSAPMRLRLGLPPEGTSVFRYALCDACRHIPDLAGIVEEFIISVYPHRN